MPPEASTATAALLARKPGPQFRSPFGLARALRRDPLRFLLDLHRRHGDVVQPRVPFFPATLVAHPDHVEHVLVRNGANYEKGAVLRRMLSPLVGNSILVADGDQWRRRRRKVQPAFHRSRLARMAETMREATEECAARWCELEAAGRPVELASEMSMLTLDIVARTLFGADLRHTSSGFADAVTDLLDYVNHVVSHPLTAPPHLPTVRNRRMRRALRVVDRAVRDIVDARRRSSGERDDLLSMLLAEGDGEDGRPLSERELRDEMVTFLIAGHETTATTLTWSWVLLSRVPDERRRLCAEVESVAGDGPLSIEHLPRLERLRRNVHEALRLYPPAWLFGRQAIGDDEIDGHRIRAGAPVFLSPWVTHRHPGLWENPEGFDPDRFLPERSRGRPRYAFFPFAGGQRKCIGDEFAIVEAQIVLGTLCRRFEVDLVPGPPIVAAPLFTLRPRDGVPAMLRLRSQANDR